MKITNFKELASIQKNLESNAIYLPENARILVKTDKATAFKICEPFLKNYPKNEKRLMNHGYLDFTIGVTNFRVSYEST